MIRKIVTLSSLLIIIGLNAQTFEWAQSFGAPFSDKGYAITTDASGNIYVSGIFGNTIDFDAGSGTANLTAVGAWDIFVQKLDASGNFLWAKSFGGSSFDEVNSITVDASGNVYTTGFFIGSVDFDPGAGEFSLTSAGSKDIFIQKLDASGDFLWAKSFGNSSDSFGSSGDFGVTVADISGNVYTTGRFQGTVDFDPGAETFNLSSAGVNDIFVQKLDASGNFLWAKSFGSNSDDSGNTITVDASGNIFIAGNFQGTVDFDPGDSTANLTSVGNSDAFVQKLDASGNFLWAKSFGGSSFDMVQSITVDASGNIFTTGGFQGAADFDPGAATVTLNSAGSRDIFLQKLDDSGNFLWAKSFGGSSFDMVQSMISDTSGDVYTTGWFEDTVDFDPGTGTANLSSVGDLDIFVQKIDDSGNFIWAKSFGGIGRDRGWSIAVDASENVYTTGWFRDTVDFDTGASTANLTSVGLQDIFVQKLSQGNLSIEELGNGIVVNTFPNPNNGFIQLTLNEALSDVEIMVTDMQGKIVYDQFFDTIINQQITIPGSSGMYLLSVKTPQGQSVMKLIKE